MLYTCIKPSCENQYESKEEEAYYCPSCIKERDTIAKQLDKQFPTTGQEVVSDLQAYDMAAKTITTPDGRQVSFMKTK